MGLPLTWSHFFVCPLPPAPTLASIALSNLLSKLQFNLKKKNICKNLSLLTKQSQLAWGKLCFCPNQSSSHLKLSQHCLKPDRNGRKIEKFNWSKWEWKNTFNLKSMRCVGRDGKSIQVSICRLYISAEIFSPSDAYPPATITFRLFKINQSCIVLVPPFPVELRQS